LVSAQKIDLSSAFINLEKPETTHLKIDYDPQTNFQWINVQSVPKENNLLKKKSLVHLNFSKTLTSLKPLTQYNSPANSKPYLKLTSPRTSINDLNAIKPTYPNSSPPSQINFRPKSLNNGRIVIKKNPKNIGTTPQSQNISMYVKTPKLEIKAINIKGLLKRDKYELKLPTTETTDMRRTYNFRRTKQSPTRGDTYFGPEDEFMKKKAYLSPKQSNRSTKYLKNISTCIPIHKLPDLLDLNPKKLHMK